MMRSRSEAAAAITLAIALAIALTAVTVPVRAQEAGASVVGKDDTGRPILRAIRLTSTLAVDGKLDEAIYRSVTPASDFIQQEPKEGAPATERTDVWVFFDDDNLYIVGRCWDSQPQRMIATEMRRDGNLMQNDNLTITLDTFMDRRTAFYFQTNPVGGLRDQQINDERNANVDWNTVWDAKTSRDESGWATEIVIPLKSLRYAASGDQTWGINVRRMVRWKNELAFLSPVPASYGQRGAFAVTFSGPLTGLQLPPIRPALELKPYVKSGVATDRRAVPEYSNDLTADAGFDFKYGLTKGLIADLTVNTDFAQVEADDQQVNLTRASLFFPEKRDFFLENQGIFAFGGTQQGTPGQNGLGPVLEMGSAPSLIPALFFSRRVGLANGFEVPIRAGVRVAGRAGAYSIGLLNIQTGESATARQASTNFSVVRVRRDIFGRSSIGMMATSRSPQTTGSGSNQAYGADATISHQDLLVTTYYSRTRTPGVTDDTSSYLFKADYPRDHFGLNFEHLSVGEGFRPDMGLIRREAFRRTYGYARYSPRPNSGPLRKVSWETTLDYITDRDNRLQSREGLAGMRVDMNSGDQWLVEYRNITEFLDTPFAVGPGVRVPVGTYDFRDVNTMYYLGPQNPVSGRFNVARGSFYDGMRTELGVQSRIDFGAMLAVEPRLSMNWVDLPQRTFRTDVIGAKVNVTLSPRMLVASLTQYTSATNTLSTNIRFRWEYTPGSDLFIVYTDGRNTSLSGFPTLDNRSFVVKATRLLRR